MKEAIKNRLMAFYVAACVALIGLCAAVPAQAQSDIDGVLTEVTTYKTTAITLAIAILLFMIGRRLVGKLAK